MIEEWRRVLKPGGKMILELPCMDKIMQYIARTVGTGEPFYPFMTLYAFWGDPGHENEAMCHKWGYFKQTLKELLEKCGMRDIRFEKPRYHFPFRDMRVECVK